MNMFATLVRLVAGGPEDEAAPLGRSQRLLLAVSAALGAIVLAGVWGLAAGGLHPGNALMNLVEVPMLLLVSALASLPAVVLLWKLTGAGRGRASDLVVSYAVATFGGTLVLGVLAPLVALYQHSSEWIGPYVASGSCVVAYATGAALLVRVFGRLAGDAVPRRNLVLPAVGIFLLQGAALAQLASVVPPVLGQRTAFGHGVDGFGLPHHHALSSSHAAEPGQ